MFNTNVPQPRINKKNFAINSRIYDASNTNPLYKQSISGKNKTSYNYSDIDSINMTTVNADTAMGQSWFH